jgi:hypothetical protein
VIGVIAIGRELKVYRNIKTLRFISQEVKCRNLPPTRQVYADHAMFLFLLSSVFNVFTAANHEYSVREDVNSLF